jgi:predicted transposase YdaD
MPYVTTIEKIGIEKGRAAGRAEGWKQASLEFALSLLRQKFGEIDEKTEASIDALTQEQLKRSTDRLLKLESLDELRDWLETARR